MYDVQHSFIYRHSDSTVSEDSGIEPSRTVATTALAVRRSNYSARSHPLARSHAQISPRFNSRPSTKSLGLNICGYRRRSPQGNYLTWMYLVSARTPLHGSSALRWQAWRRGRGGVRWGAPAGSPAGQRPGQPAPPADQPPHQPRIHSSGQGTWSSPACRIEISTSQRKCCLREVEGPDCPRKTLKTKISI